MTRRRFLEIETLEDRLTPSTVWGQPWPDPGHLTLSFAPDGTDTGGSPSNLQQLLNAQNRTLDWQTAILQAFQTWAVNANINIGLVSDGAQPLGAGGAVQGDSRFGDIRVAAKPLAPTSVSTASPFSWSGTTWSGDVLLNNLANFGLNGHGQYDLFTIALHEAGHSFGLGDTTASKDSILYQSYQGPRTGLTADDIAALQALYGKRQTDSFDHLYGNHSFGSAAPISNDPSQLAFEADITTIGQQDYFKITTPNWLLLNGLQVQVKASGVSLLEPTLNVYDASQNLLGSAAASSPLNNDLTIYLNNVRPNKTYYIKVSDATKSVFGIGGYQVGISYSTVLTGLLNSVLWPVVHFLGNTASSLLSALPLPSAYGPDNSDERFDYLWRAGLIGGETDYYQVQSPATPGASSSVMHVIAWGTDQNGLYPILHVFDPQGNPLAIQILGNSNGLYSVQVPSVAPGSKYYVEVAAYDPRGSNNIGIYELGIKFDGTAAPVTMNPLDSNQLAGASAAVVSSLVMKQNGLFHFSLAADNGSSNSSAVITLSIVDQTGKVVFTVDASTGRPPSTGVVYLTAGTYSVRVSVKSTSGTYLPVNYWLAGEMLSDPMGPYQANNTNGSTSSSASGGGYVYNGSANNSSPPGQPTYY